VTCVLAVCLLGGQPRASSSLSLGQCGGHGGTGRWRVKGRYHDCLDSKSGTVRPSRRGDPPVSKARLEQPDLEFHCHSPHCHARRGSIAHADRGLIPEAGASAVTEVQLASTQASGLDSESERRVATASTQNPSSS
jgi:hypothetical protein